MNIKEKIVNLTNSANLVTGVEADNLTDAMQNLVDGYGGGGGSEKFNLNTDVIWQTAFEGNQRSGIINYDKAYTDFDFVRFTFHASEYGLNDDVVFYLPKILYEVGDTRKNSEIRIATTNDYIRFNDLKSDYLQIRSSNNVNVLKVEFGKCKEGITTEAVQLTEYSGSKATFDLSPYEFICLNTSGDPNIQFNFAQISGGVDNVAYLYSGSSYGLYKWKGNEYYFNRALSIVYGIKIIR